MAMCEKCTKQAFHPTQMFIDRDTEKFVGPCCAAQGDVPVSRPQVPPVQVLPFKTQNDGLEYGIELSNKVGVHAYLNYQGLQISFERTPAQLRKWAEQQGLVQTGT